MVNTARCVDVGSWPDEHGRSGNNHDDWRTSGECEWEPELDWKVVDCVSEGDSESADDAEGLLVCVSVDIEVRCSRRD